MAQFEMKIRGRVIKSDLELDHVDGALIYFVGGSWCNADTCEVNLIGDGYINISGDPTAPAAERKTVEMTFEPRALKVTGLYAELEVIPHAENIIKVTVEGTEDAIKNITAKELGAYLVVGGGKSLGGLSGASVSVKRIVQGGDIISNLLGLGSTVLNQTFIGSIGNPGPKVTIKVPMGTDISIPDMNGSVTIGDIDGNVELVNNSDDNAAIGSVKNLSAVVSDDGDLTVSDVAESLHIIVKGDGETTIDSVNGTIVAKIKDDGDLTINGGQATLDFVSTGDGDFIFDGVATNASISLEDDGDVTINEITGDSHIKSSGDGEMVIEKANGKLSVSMSDDGDVTIQGGRLTGLTITNSNAYGDFNFSGVSSEVVVNSSGDGNVNISEVEDNLNVQLSGDGDCSVRRGSVAKLFVKVADDGSFSYKGTALDADLKTTSSSYGDIYVYRVQNRPYTSNKGDGDITIGNWDED